MLSKKPFRPRLPDFLKQKLPSGKDFVAVRGQLAEHRLHTVCEEAHCPNRTHCYSRGSLAFQILGDICTRRCGFCAEKFGKPIAQPDPTEASRLVETAKNLNLRHVVITAPTRDDLLDGGSKAFADVVTKLRKELPLVTSEILVPDFQENDDNLRTVFDSRPTIFNHNVETVRRLTPKVRSVATYDGSLRVLKKAQEAGLTTKSGFMVGHGETKEELTQTMKDLAAVGCQILTIGQYLPPSEHHLPLNRITTPAEFDEMRQEALQWGLLDVAAGPLVRSSFHAEEAKAVQRT